MHLEDDTDENSDDTTTWNMSEAFSSTQSKYF